MKAAKSESGDKKTYSCQVCGATVLFTLRIDNTYEGRCKKCKTMYQIDAQDWKDEKNGS